MKSMLLFLGCFFLGATSVHGETMYITDVFRVMVRTGPDVQHKIISMPKSGTPVEKLEVLDENTDQPWVKVRLPNDKEGWMLGQHLVSGPPKKEIISRLEEQNRALDVKAKKLAVENSHLKEERNELKRALSKKTRSSNSIRKSYETLKRESKDFLSLKAAHEKTTQELETKTKEAARLKKEVEGLRNSQTLRWFIAGASVIVVGFVIGYASRRPKRRSSLL